MIRRDCWEDKDQIVTHGGNACNRTRMVTTLNAAVSLRPRPSRKRFLHLKWSNIVRVTTTYRVTRRLLQERKPPDFRAGTLWLTPRR